MPLYDPNAEVIEREVVPVPAVTEPEATTPTYDSRDIPGPKLIMDIEGEPWLCEYYKQVLNSNESPRILDLNLDPTVQQYLHIAQFRISVTDDLSSSTDPTTGTVTITGEGLLYPDTVYPNVGDMFIANVEYGTKAIFTLTQVERLTFYKRSVYRISYRVYSDYDVTIVEDLKSKVVEDKFFDNKRLITGNNPIVSYDTVNREEIYNRTITHYMDRLYAEFYDHDIKTFKYIQDGFSIWDPFAVAFFNTVLGKYCRKDRPMPTEYSYGDTTRPMARPTLWRAIHRADMTGISYLYPRNYSRIGTDSIDEPGAYHSISYLSVDYVLYPDVWNTSTLDLNAPAYVLSHAFYEQDAGNMSQMEIAVTRMIKGESITNAVLDSIINNVDQLTGKELFYGILLLTAMLKIKLQEV